MSKRGFGVTGALELRTVRRIAVEVEANGFDSFWVNDTPQGDGIAALAAAAEVTQTIQLAVGVIPVDRRPADEIARRVTEFGLPLDRVMIGIGSGRTRIGGLALVSLAAQRLHEEVGVPIVVGALGPKMCSLAGAAADGVLLNWLTPEKAEESASLVRAAAASIGRPNPHVAAYIRTALGEHALPKLQQEASRYERIPQYARHFQAMGVSGVGTSVAGQSREDVQSELDRFTDTLDEIVVRAITVNDAADHYLALVEAAAPDEC